MGIVSNIRKYFFKENTIQVILVDGTKKVYLKDVVANNNTFSDGEGKDKRSYIIDEKAIYYFKDKPVLFYRKGNASPITFQESGIDNTLSTKELTSLMQNKVIEDLLKSTETDFDINFVLQMATAGIALVILLNDIGVLNLAYN